MKINELEAQAEQGIDSTAVAKLLVECYFTMLLEHRVFHADPHPGNFLVRPGPKLVILDYGAVEELTPALSSGMKVVILGAITRNDDSDPRRSRTDGVRRRGRRSRTIEAGRTRVPESTLRGKDRGF